MSQLGGEETVQQWGPYRADADVEDVEAIGEDERGRLDCGRRTRDGVQIRDLRTSTHQQKSVHTHTAAVPLQD